MAKGPRFTRFIRPLLAVLREKGGSASASEATDAVIELVGVPDVELERVNKNGQSNIRNQIAWARFYLARAGILESSGRGVWSLTAQGLKLDPATIDPGAFFKEWHARSTGDSDAPAGPSEESGPPDVPTVVSAGAKQDDGLLGVMRRLPPAGFERLCQRLLREQGFEQVEVTGRSGDGGIDGRGVLALNAIISMQVMFQCKRYQGSVGAAAIRDFRGAVVGRDVRAVLLTTGTFTADARREAAREGAQPIELIDGERLVQIFQNLELGVHRRVVYEVNEDFFKEFQ